MYIYPESPSQIPRWIVLKAPRISSRFSPERPCVGSSRRRRRGHFTSARQSKTNFCCLILQRPWCPSPEPKEKEAIVARMKTFSQNNQATFKSTEWHFIWVMKSNPSEMQPWIPCERSWNIAPSLNDGNNDKIFSPFGATTKSCKPETREPWLCLELCYQCQRMIVMFPMSIAK